MKLKNVFVALIMSLGLSFQAVARDYNDQPGMYEVVADGLIVRPLTLGGAAVGLVSWVVTLPYSIPTGNAGEWGKDHVLRPLKCTFNRPLGEIAPCP